MKDRDGDVDCLCITHESGGFKSLVLSKSNILIADLMDEDFVLALQLPFRILLLFFLFLLQHFHHLAFTVTVQLRYGPVFAILRICYCIYVVICYNENVIESLHRKGQKQQERYE